MFAEHIDLEIDLDIARAVIQRAERRFAVAADSHEAARDADFFVALFLAFEVVEFLVDVGRMVRDIIAVAERRHAHLAERLHLLAADLHHLIEVFRRGRLLLPLFLLVFAQNKLLLSL